MDHQEKHVAKFTDGLPGPLAPLQLERLLADVARLERLAALSVSTVPAHRRLELAALRRRLAQHHEAMARLVAYEGLCEAMADALRTREYLTRVRNGENT